LELITGKLCYARDLSYIFAAGAWCSTANSISKNPHSLKPKNLAIKAAGGQALHACHAGRGQKH
jgi:hypothetical protein